MKKRNVQSIVEEIDREKLIIYMGNGIEMEADASKRIVLFTHELKRSGAPSVLLDMSKVLMELGYTVFLVSDEDGELLEDFIQCGVSVVFYEEMVNDPRWLIKIAELFPEILVNTMVLMHIVDFLATYAQSLYWWIHEAEIGIANWAERFEVMQKSNNLEIWAASPLIKKNIREYWNWEAKSLNFYIEDVPKKRKTESTKLRIINVGDVNGNKGQEILAAAFEKLDKEIRDRCELYFCGYNQRYNAELLSKLLDYIDMRENVYLIGGMPKEELYDFYDDMDIVVVASNYESTSAVAVEGMMKEKLCICTETCGVCEYLKDGESVLTFPRRDAVSLANVLKKAIEQYDELEYMRKNGRKVYEANYTKAVFTKRICELLK